MSADVAATPRDEPHNSGAPSLNYPGLVFIIFVVLYTLFLLVGLGLIWRFRRATPIRIRGLVVTFAAVLFLHLYVAALFIAYPMNGEFTCGQEFWSMNTMFPIGIGLYQASNVRLLAVAKKQHQGFDEKKWAVRKPPFSYKPLAFRTWFNHLSYENKTYVFILLGIVVQLVLTSVLFSGSRRFHPNSGWFGKYVDPTTCRTGAEWVPSTAWQFLWAWVIGPVVLLKARHIKDTHYWAWQTRLSVIASLPGAPLWVAFLYADTPSTRAVNTWIPPAMWFAPGLITMQMSSIIIPLYDVWVHRQGLKPKNVERSMSRATTLRPARNSTGGRASKDIANDFAAFIFQVNYNIDPLAHFAAYRDFTAENIEFLRRVRDFKRKWRLRISCRSSEDCVFSRAEQRDMFEDAARIYFELVDQGASRMSINIDAKTYYDLEQMFKTLGYEPPADQDAKSISSSKSGSTTRKRNSAVAPWASPIQSTESLVETPALTPQTQTDTQHVATIGGHHFVNIPVDRHMAVNPFTAHPVIHGNADILMAATPGARNPFSDAAAASTPESSPSINAVPQFPCPSKSASSPATESCCRERSPTPEALPRINGGIASTSPAAAANEDPRQGRIINIDPVRRISDPLFVPCSFGIKVFDAAEKSIQWLVYTNTWKGFVRSADAESISSNVTGRTGTTVVGEAEMQRGSRYFRHKDPSPRQSSPSGAGRITSGYLEDYRRYGMSGVDEESDEVNFQFEAHRRPGDHRHHGVLDAAKGPVKWEEVDAKCAACRRKERQKMERMLSQ